MTDFADRDFGQFGNVQVVEAVGVLTPLIPQLGPAVGFFFDGCLVSKRRHDGAGGKLVLEVGDPSNVVVHVVVVVVVVVVVGYGVVPAFVTDG